MPRAALQKRFRRSKQPSKCSRTIPRGTINWRSPTIEWAGKKTQKEKRSCRKKPPKEWNRHDKGLQARRNSSRLTSDGKLLEILPCMDCRLGHCRLACYCAESCSAFRKRQRD